MLWSRWSFVKIPKSSFLQHDKATTLEITVLSTLDCNVTRRTERTAKSPTETSLFSPSTSAEGRANPRVVHPRRKYDCEHSQPFSRAGWASESHLNIRSGNLYGPSMTSALCRCYCRRRSIQTQRDRNRGCRSRGCAGDDLLAVISVTEVDFFNLANGTDGHVSVYIS